MPEHETMIERRVAVPGLSVEMEKRDDGAEPSGKKFLQGYAARFGVIADLYWFDEEILPGAFSESIEKDDIRALIDHDPSLIIGRNRAKTLDLSEDTNGLYSKIDPPATRIGEDIIISVERGDIDGMSFQFIVQEERWIWADERGGKKNDLRQIAKAALRDVSIVTFPAYVETDVSYRAEVRSAEAVFKQHAGRERRYRKNNMLLLKRYVEHCQLCN